MTYTKTFSWDDRSSSSFCCSSPRSYQSDYLCDELSRALLSFRSCFSINPQPSMITFSFMRFQYILLLFLYFSFLLLRLVPHTLGGSPDQTPTRLLWLLSLYLVFSRASTSSTCLDVPRRASTFWFRENPESAPSIFFKIAPIRLLFLILCCKHRAAFVTPPASVCRTTPSTVFLLFSLLFFFQILCLSFVPSQFSRLPLFFSIFVYSTFTRRLLDVYWRSELARRSVSLGTRRSVLIFDDSSVLFTFGTSEYTVFRFQNDSSRHHNQIRVFDYVDRACASSLIR